MKTYNQPKTGIFTLSNDKDLMVLFGANAVSSNVIGGYTPGGGVDPSEGD